MKAKNGEFNSDFGGFGKNRGVGDLQIENTISKKNCKIEFLVVLSY